MKYLEIQSPLKTIDKTTDSAIALVTELITHNTFVDEDYTTKNYVTLQYYRNLQAYMRGEDPLTLRDGSKIRRMLYTGVEEIHTNNVYRCIAPFANGVLTEIEF